MVRRRGTKLLLDKLLPQRRDIEQTEKVASSLLQATSSSSKKSLYLKGVHNGRFYRFRIKPKTEGAKHHMVPLPGDGEVPHAFKTVQTAAKKISSRKKTKASSTAASAATAASEQQGGLRLPGFLKGGGDFSWEESIAYAKAWWTENWSTVVLNFGSICTLIGFTRSDVLELRCLSVTGSTANVIYHFTQTPLRYLPVGWSALFAVVNSIKIREILLERHSNVHMSPEQEDIYIQFFMPHGVTPRQFQILQECGKEVVIPKGEAIIRQGEVCDHVSLIVKGSTRASISGRRLTAASAIAPKSITEEKAGGNSGAWVGEMTFLEHYHNKLSKKRKKVAATSEKAKPMEESKTAVESKSAEEVTKTTSEAKSENNAKSAAAAAHTKPAETKNVQTGDPATAKQNGTSAITAKTNDINDESDGTTATTVQNQQQQKPKRTAAEKEFDPPPINRYTIVASDECVIWVWSFDQVETMMNRSTDFRASLTRAMTAAIVAKVVNFTVSKTADLPTWTTWLDDWRYNAGARVNVNTDDDMDDDSIPEEAKKDEEKYHFDEHGVI